MVAGCSFAIYQAFSFDPLEQSAQVDDPGTDSRHARGSHDRGDRSQRHHGARGRHARNGTYTHHDWGRETELARAVALHLPGPSFWQDAQQNGPPRNDPQLHAMWRSYRNGMPAPGEDPELPFEPTAHRAELVDATGDVSSSPNSCDVRVLPVTSGRFNCVVRVMCDGRVLYPNSRQTAGYVPCEIEDGRPIRALDDGHTAHDGDPLVDLDLTRGTVRIEEYDESGQQTYSATLRIQS